MKDVLYGVKLVILEEIDAVSQLPVDGGVKCRINTAESAEMEAVSSEGEEEVARTDDRILAVVSTPDLLYGYNVTLTDNTFDAAVAALIEGGVIEKDENGNVTGYRSPFISEGSTNMKPFRAKIYVANYEGDSIKNYVVITFNKCTGTAPGMNAAKEFYAPEYTIKAREATKAGLPIKSLSYVDSLPAADAPTALKVSIGTLANDKITAIPEETTVAEFLAGITVSAGASKKVINANGYDVTTGSIEEGMTLRVFLPTEITAKTDYSLSLA
jgi:hypothetical protein